MTSLVDNQMELDQTFAITFHKFPQLPPELRVMIWRFVSKTPRTLTLDWAIKKRGAPMVIEHFAKTVPAVLHISHESRSTAARHYEFYYSSRLNIKPLYINFNVDTLMIGDWEALDLFYAGLKDGQNSWPADLLELESKVKLLTFAGPQLSPRFENLQWILWRFSNLRELVLLERQPDVQNNGGFWSRRRWDFHLRELDRAIKHLASKNEEFEVRYMTEEESWAMRTSEEAKNQKALEERERKEREATNAARKALAERVRSQSRTTDLPNTTLLLQQPRDRFRVS
ncbi:hypothetical protein L207DRAFT_631995 [Hyaloscypha variabilis F]|uniref:2EXR domain-containing protein n=1 Tax=Hyaloscypha variabilis (strain UAMH 11265 / GT02V1 / F) TaxID=1149755 RepID=A0A2J6RUG9_HYAVF|nr:hypothetical protein L207DRAFT_631995 [Hyaloscypha variabilis F]